MLTFSSLVLLLKWSTACDRVCTSSAPFAPRCRAGGSRPGARLPGDARRGAAARAAGEVRHVAGDGHRVRRAGHPPGAAARHALPARTDDGPRGEALAHLPLAVSVDARQYRAVKIGFLKKSCYLLV